MEIIASTVMEDGTKIQLEDWHMHGSQEYPSLYGYTIGAYPIAKNTGKYGWVRKGKTFRFSISRNEYRGITDDVVIQDWIKLYNGNAKLEDFVSHVTEHKYLYYLGVAEYEDYWEEINK